MITVTITKETEFVYRGFETASWWVKYELLPGTYEVVPYSNLSYYRHFKAKARRVEEHFVNRLFGSSSLADQSSRVGQIEEVWVGFPDTYLWNNRQQMKLYQDYHPTFKIEGMSD